MSRVRGRPSDFSPNLLCSCPPSWPGLQSTYTIFFPYSPEPSVSCPQNTLPQGPPRPPLWPSSWKGSVDLKLLHLLCISVRKASPREGQGLRQGHRAALGQGEGQDDPLTQPAFPDAGSLQPHLETSLQAPSLLSLSPDVP